MTKKECHANLISTVSCYNITPDCKTKRNTLSQNMSEQSKHDKSGSSNDQKALLNTLKRQKQNPRTGVVFNML